MTFEQEFEAPDVYAAGLFPICPATHDLGIGRLFDLATLLMILDCRPRDTVLDLGAGSGFSTEMLARLGYDVVALDPDFSALRHNRRRPTWDRARIEGRTHVVQSVAEGLPFRRATFDGVLGMNVLHHVPDLTPVVSELARVLKPGCRAVFVEPGLDHLKSRETQKAIREHGEDDRAFDVVKFLQESRGCGFRNAMLTATLPSALRLLPVEEIELYRSGQHPRLHLRPAGVLEELERRHAFAMIERDGVRPKTSRHPGELSCALRADGVPTHAARGSRFEFVAHAINTGDTMWEKKPSRLGGFVTVGCKLLSVEGRLLNDRLGRTFLPHDVGPRESISLVVSVDIPEDLPSGEYRFQIDLVDEQICWFGDLGGSVLVQPLHVT
jgi:SAM-dependent methyltransferase